MYACGIVSNNNTIKKKIGSAETMASPQDLWYIRSIKGNSTFSLGNGPKHAETLNVFVYNPCHQAYAEKYRLRLVFFGPS